MLELGISDSRLTLIFLLTWASPFTYGNTIPFPVNGGSHDYVSQGTAEYRKKVHVGGCSVNTGHEYFVFRACINLVVLLNLVWVIANWY